MFPEKLVERAVRDGGQQPGFDPIGQFPVSPMHEKIDGRRVLQENGFFDFYPQALAIFDFFPTLGYSAGKKIEPLLLQRSEQTLVVAQGGHPEAVVP